MTKEYIKSIQEVFGDLSKLTPAKMQEFVDRTARYFDEMKEQFGSGKKVSEEALLEAAEVKDVLHKQMNAICEKIGLDPAKLAPFVERPAALGPSKKVKKSKKINLVA
jgi:hypothetical protein